MLQFNLNYYFIRKSIYMFPIKFYCIYIFLTNNHLRCRNKLRAASENTVEIIVTWRKRQYMIGEKHNDVSGIPHILFIDHKNVSFIIKVNIKSIAFTCMDIGERRASWATFFLNQNIFAIYCHLNSNYTSVCLAWSQD